MKEKKNQKSETPKGVGVETEVIFFCGHTKESNMKTKYKWIEFIYNGDRKSWDVWNHKFNQYLGFIKFNVSRNWKEWEFLPDSYTSFTKQCLADIIDFQNQLDVSKKI